MKLSSSFEQVGVRMQMLKSFCKLYHCIMYLRRKVVGNEKVPTESVFGFLISPLVQKL